MGRLVTKAPGKVLEWGAHTLGYLHSTVDYELCYTQQVFEAPSSPVFGFFRMLLTVPKVEEVNKGCWSPTMEPRFNGKVGSSRSPLSPALNRS